MTNNLDPDVADLLRAVRDHLAGGGDEVIRRTMHVRGVLGTVIRGDASLRAATWAFATLAGVEDDLMVCDTCRAEPVTVIDGDRRQCSTCALKVCDCCQMRRATTAVGATELCPLCAEEREAESLRLFREAMAAHRAAGEQSKTAEEVLTEHLGPEAAARWRAGQLRVDGEAEVTYAP